MSRYYVGLDLHKASICIAVLNAEGKLVMESFDLVEDSTRTMSRDEPGQGALPLPRHPVCRR